MIKIGPQIQITARMIQRKPRLETNAVSRRRRAWQRRDDATVHTWNGNVAELIQMKRENLVGAFFRF